MHRLLDFPLQEPKMIAALRRKAAAEQPAAQIDLGFALATAGCSYEAAAILRPLRTQWKSHGSAQAGRSALEAQTWWNKHWKTFVQAKRAGKTVEALNLLDGRAAVYWDLPPLLVHLGDIAKAGEEFDLAEHLYLRVAGLARRGLPGMNMAPFTYVAEASLIDVLLSSGQPAEALKRHRALVPNAGNAMAHEIQHAILLVANGDLDGAIRQAAATLVTAETQRSGYSRQIRKDFIDTAPELAPLRRLSDWQAMLDDPAAYLRNN